MRSKRLGWKRLAIEETCSRITSGGTPLRSNRKFYDGGSIPWVKTGELKDWYIEDTDEKITEQAIKESSAKLLPRETVLMAMYGDGRTITSLGLLRNESACNQASCALITNPDVCSPLFLFYSLKAKRHALLQLAYGGAQRNLNAKTIRQFKIDVPPIQVQERIASILSAYDHLIENNTRRIKILGETAQMIYREWFVNFRFPGHERVRMTDSALGPVPVGWTTRNLFDVSHVTYGFPFKSKLFTQGGDGTPVIRIRDIKDDFSNTMTTESVDPKYLVENGDLLVGMDGDFHMGKWAGSRAYLNQRVVRFRPRIEVSPYFLFLALQAPIQHFDSTIVGTTVAHLSDRDLRSVNLAIPSDDIRARSTAIFDPLFKLEISLKLKNFNLCKTREFLLPKLISGEIPVEAAEDAAAELVQEVAQPA
jgi:type I restriction enzyme, S subunit